MHLSVSHSTQSHVSTQCLTRHQVSNMPHGELKLRVPSHSHWDLSPPYSLKNKMTNSMFLNDFTELTTKLLPNHPNNIILGDFNLHISDTNDIDAAIFNEPIKAMGLYQHVGIPTHKSGNTPDVVLGEISNQHNILTVALKPYISDHCAIITTLNLTKHNPWSAPCMVRHIHSIQPDEWLQEFKSYKHSILVISWKTQFNLSMLNLPEH